MRVTVREAAALLHAPEEKVYSWIESGDLPAHRINDQYRINRSELLEWATARKLSVDPALFHEDDEDERIPSVAESLERGGVFHDVEGTTREEALRSIIALLKLDDEGDREALLQLLLARDAAAVVPVGDGIAHPPRAEPDRPLRGRAVAVLFFLRQPVDFDAPDGKPVFALFFLVSPTTRVHLQMLAKIAFLLRDAGFREAIRGREPAARLIDSARTSKRRLMRPTTLELLAVASALVAFSGLPGLLVPRGAAPRRRIATCCHVLGCALGVAAAALALAGQTRDGAIPWPLPGGAPTFALDRLSAFFLVPVFVVAGLGSVYGEGYWPEAEHPDNGRKLRCFYGLATAGLALVMVAGDAWSFLVGWEVVALAAFFLVTTEQDDAAALRAGWIYLVATHAGTLVLFAMFALLRDATGGWLLAPSAALGSSRS